MNYYPHHIGDYDSHTAHLNWLEDAAYSRLLRLYYRTEQPIPAKLEDACRLVRAHSKHERAAVEQVLREFFRLEADGWHSTRCDAEISQYRDKSVNHWAAKLPRHIRTAMQGERNAIKVKASPKWLSKEDRAAIANVYSEAAKLTAKTGTKHEVDHIVPLRSMVVCGLHVDWNLQAIPAYKNRAKSNSFEVT